MGAWHTGIYDNDTALDFMGKVAEHIAIEMNPTSNEEILVLADIVSKYSYPTPLDSALFVQTIKDELDNIIECWKEECRESRKEVLLKLLSDSTRYYINNEDNTIIYPVGMTEEGDFIVQLFSKGNDMKEMELDIDCVMTKYSPFEEYVDFTITIDGIDNNEVQEYFNIKRRDKNE